MPNDKETPIESIEAPESGNETTDPTPTTPESRPERTKAESNRQNGAKSRGPITPEGKSASSQNALRHGEYAKDLTLKKEDGEMYARTLASLEAEFKPQTDFEADLVLIMAHARWRTIRMWNFEKATLDQAIAAAARSNTDDNATQLDLFAVAWQQLSDNTASLRMIDRHENRYDRTFTRAMNQLFKYRVICDAAKHRDTKNADVKIEGTNPKTPQKTAFPPAVTNNAPPNSRPVRPEYTARERRLKRLGARIIKSARRFPVIYPIPGPQPDEPCQETAID
jgi:hypothetical protein